MQTGFQANAFQNDAFQILIALAAFNICSLNTEVRIGSVAMTMQTGSVATTVDNGSLNIMIRCS